MVFETLFQLLCDHYACEQEDVTMASSLDDLNLTDDERTDIAVLLQEQYGVEIPAAKLAGFATVEDMVGYIEDRL